MAGVALCHYGLENIQGERQSQSSAMLSVNLKRKIKSTWRINMQIETRKLTELVPYPRNPREISKETYQDLKGKKETMGTAWSID